ncbi:hypothetical protein HERIO_2760 [Hepatospora eriocheir]|uniref:Uncharacterized protein n=1 Tax=Hepatospora eriocheir TaxID=1081669 RepID=A0A1X0QBR7_9MICR|nr:hypothetical protein HERIO_2760 [Hepatospora eriocheir]
MILIILLKNFCLLNILKSFCKMFLNDFFTCLIISKKKQINFLIKKLICL